MTQGAGFISCIPGRLGLYVSEDGSDVFLLTRDSSPRAELLPRAKTRTLPRTRRECRICLITAPGTRRHRGPMLTLADRARRRRAGPCGEFGDHRSSNSPHECSTSGVAAVSDPVAVTSHELAAVSRGELVKLQEASSLIRPLTSRRSAVRARDPHGMSAGVVTSGRPVVVHGRLPEQPALSEWLA